MSVYVLTLFESNFIAPLVAGWLNDAIGWRWTMRFGAIFAAGAFVVLFFGMEETMFGM
jgi:MFS family permease